MDGILVIDKPQGPTSFDVVRKVRGLLRIKKVGHTGTLDPLATGVLPLCLGEATKLAGYITLHDKAYQAVIRLGQQTDTQDAQGKVVNEAPIPTLSREFLEGALEPFRGTYEQIPPMFSAVKQDGKRLYELAREGKEVDRPARSVTVHALALLDFSATELTIEVRCSKGFFVRTLAHELGQALGCFGHIKALRRTQSGPFGLARALTLEKLGTAVQEGKLAGHLMPISEALGEMPSVQVDAKAAERVSHGVPVEVRAQPGTVRVLGPDQGLLAIAEVGPDGRLSYRRVLNSAQAGDA